MTTVKGALDDASAALTGHDPQPRLGAEALLGQILGRERAYFYAHPEGELSREQTGAMAELVRRRAAGEPLQYLTGRQEFYGRDFAVSPAALIPRPETEMVVAAALERIAPGEDARIVDVGTGSGCIAVTLALERPAARVVATEISAAALALAAGNAARLGARVEWVECDLLDGAGGLFDLVISNPPYIAERDFAGLQTEVRDFEPRQALIAGPSGAEVYARLIPQAWRSLHAGGWLVLELGYDSAPAVRRLLGGGWSEIEFRRDAQGHERVAAARSQ